MRPFLSRLLGFQGTNKSAMKKYIYIDYLFLQNLLLNFKGAKLVAA